MLARQAENEHREDLTVSIDGHQIARNEILHASFGEITISGDNVSTFDNVSKEVSDTFNFYKGMVDSPGERTRRALITKLRSMTESGDRQLFAANTLSLLETVEEEQAGGLTLDDYREHAHLFGTNRRTPNASQFSHNFARQFAMYQYSILRLERHITKARRNNTGQVQSLETALQQLADARPWKKINQIFESASFDFRVNNPDDFDENGHKYEFKLKKTTDGSVISPQELSTGEKIILALALAKYNMEQENHSPVKLLLLDEPDAPLHPTRIKELVDTLKDVFLQQGQAVIMTTHSPSNIAAAPPASL